MFLARRNKSAPVANACRYNANPVKPRSARSTIPGGNTRVNNPTDTRSDKRVAVSGFSIQHGPYPKTTPL